MSSIFAGAMTLRLVAAVLLSRVRARLVSMSPSIESILALIMTQVHIDPLHLREGKRKVPSERCLASATQHLSRHAHPLIDQRTQRHVRRSMQHAAPERTGGTCRQPAALPPGLGCCQLCCFQFAVPVVRCVQIYRG